MKAPELLSSQQKQGGLRMEKLERDWRQEQGKWLISSDFVKRIPKIDSRGEARRILRAMAKSGKVRCMHACIVKQRAHK